MLGFHDLHLGGTKDKSQSKDLQRLNRQDLLELLVAQMREGDELRATIEKKELQVENLSAQVERLKEKLDIKDEQIDNLKEKLDLKDSQMDHLKSRLDDKDGRLKVLKGRLDFKDAVIAHLSEAAHMSLEDLEILEARERVLEHEAVQLEVLGETQVESQSEEPLDE